MSKVPIHVLMVDETEDIFQSLTSIERKSGKAEICSINDDSMLQKNSGKICFFIQDISMPGITYKEVSRMMEEASSRIEIIMLAHPQKEQNKCSGEKYGPYDFVY